MKTIIVEGGYRIDFGNNSFQRLTDKELVDFIKEEELNFTYLDKPDELTEVCPACLLKDNYENIIDLYLQKHGV